MDINLSEEQKLLQRAGRDLLAKECTSEVVRAAEDSATGYPVELWKKMADLGWLGLIIPEKLGGQGQDNVSLAVLSTELGRALTPGPFLTSAVLSASALLSGGTATQKATYLPKIASGESVISFAALERSGTPSPTDMWASGRLQATDYVLSATKLFVDYANVAEYFLVPALTEDRGLAPEARVSLFLVPAKSRGIEITPLYTMAKDKQYEVSFHDVTVPKGSMIGKPGHGWSIVEQALFQGVIGLCGYMVGLASRAHDLAVEYAKTRIQFGKPIGAFQGVSFPLAQVATELRAAETLTHFCAWTLDRKRPAREAVATAKVFTGQVCKYATQVASETFGGLGFMSEVDVTLCLRRGKQLQLTLGGPWYWLDIMAEEILDKDTVTVPWRLEA